MAAFFPHGSPGSAKSRGSRFRLCPKRMGPHGAGPSLRRAICEAPPPQDPHLPGFPPPGSQTVANGLAAQGRAQGQRGIISLDMEAYQTFVFGSKSCGGQQWPETKGLRTHKCPIRLFFLSYKTVLRVL